MLCCFQLNYISTIFFTYFHIWLLKISGTKNCYWALSKLAHQGMKKLSHISKTVTGSYLKLPNHLDVLPIIPI